MDTLTLLDGRSMPAIGFGTWPLTDAEAETVVAQAIENGYRLIDTAARYDNEMGVGRGLRASGLARDDLFVTTKLWNTDQGYDTAIAACEASLDRLGLDALDLYLIHWPVPHWDRYLAAWEALLELRERGLVRSVGVSNFARPHLERIIAETGVTPVVNQIELHPYLSQPAMRSFHAEQAIVTQSWSPLGRGTDALRNPVIARIAGRLGVTPGQVILRWHRQIGAAPIPKSSDPARMRQNLDLDGFTLDETAMRQLDRLNIGQRVGGDPFTHET